MTNARAPLACGMAAGPIYLLVGFGQALTREGFDIRQHALSLLANGDMGWIQVATFWLAGLLVIAGAFGMRRVLHPGRGGTWAPLLLALYGIGLIGAGVFPADPGQGFPPGAPTRPTALSTDGLMHFVFGGIGFYALIGACLVFARRFSRLGLRAWATYSAFTGIAFLAAFAAMASGQASTAVMLTFYVAVAWIWIWHAAVHRKLMNESGTSGRLGEPPYPYRGVNTP